MGERDTRHGAGTYDARRAAPEASPRYASAVTFRNSLSELGIVLVAACGHPASTLPPLAPAPRATVATDACVLTTDSAPPPAALTIAVPDVGRFLERQVYETLVRIDCTGTPVPELAQAWTSDDGGHRWTFTLRPAARFSDGTPLLASDVFAVLTRDSSLLGQSAVALEGHDQISVRFAQAAASVPAVFADPALAVTRRAAASSWLVGSGVATRDSTIDAATLTPAQEGTGRPTVTVRPDSGVDARDLLDRGVDILVTSEPEVLSYAARRGDLITVPLPWSRVYVLVSPVASTIGDTVRASLARDVVRTDARPARGNYWWLAGPACPVADTTAPASTGTGTAEVIYYPRGDGPARDLAGRLVALGLEGSTGKAVGVVPADFEVLFAAGTGSFLMSLPREALAPCQAVEDLVSRAPWLRSDPGRRITALVETRDRAIVRRGGSAFTVDWDGTLRLR